MRHLLSLAICTMICSWPNGATQPPVSAAERLRADAVSRRDARAYDRLAANDLVVIDRTGAIGTKADRLVAVLSGIGIPRNQGERDIDVRRFGDVALVMGRSAWKDNGRDAHDYFSRVWAQQNGKWELVATHTTDVTRAVDKGEFDLLERPVLPLPVATTAPGPDAAAEVRRAITEQHQAYWSKDPERYRRYAGADLVRIAETGVRPREALIRMMRGNSRLPAPPSQQHDVSVRLFGNSAVTTWLDEGHDALGRIIRNRFTVVFARRGDAWQMVHIQSTGVKRPDGG